MVLSPLLAFCALRIRMTSPGLPFKQSRIGRDGQAFDVFKFRTMYQDADQRKHELEALNDRDDGMFKITDDPRITPFGAKLRRSSLDELPQLFNVLRGEMSLVGPRPLIESEASLVADHYVMRFHVKPGITGPWQVLGRSDIPFEKMIKLDYAYVVSWSIGEDLRLLVRTASAMMHGRGAY